MTIEPTDPRDGILMRLRAEAALAAQTSKAGSDEGRIVACDVAILVTDSVSKTGPTLPSDVLRSVAVALAATRQSFLADNHLSARELDESMPVLRHLSNVAEQLAAVGDELAAQELAQRRFANDVTSPPGRVTSDRDEPWLAHLMGTDDDLRDDGEPTEW